LGKRAVVSHISRKTSEIPGFSARGPRGNAYAAFFTESRMKFIGPNKPYRKSGGMGHPAFVVRKDLFKDVE
jgi:hypothetical protein